MIFNFPKPGNSIIFFDYILIFFWQSVVMSASGLIIFYFKDNLKEIAILSDALLVFSGPSNVRKSLLFSEYSQGWVVSTYVYLYTIFFQIIFLFYSFIIAASNSHEFKESSRNESSIFPAIIVYTLFILANLSVLFIPSNVHSSGKFLINLASSSDISRCIGYSFMIPASNALFFISLNLSGRA